ncbi:FAD-binding protein [Paenibacillus barcinonensis]|uniref:FAD-binding protein n=1 Tax=Paenibacillus barcinonensis TaxID=198119 RepID=UPI001C0FC0F5|nr:FAD-binding protein [Paenibacillus barcinonensis]MBU5351914.1 FAD-binding protein [Paenibacillus barcinonensis]
MAGLLPNKKLFNSLFSEMELMVAMNKPKQWNFKYDVIVMGTGGAALVSAILAHDHGAKVLIIEKTAQLGGTTAFSGGVLWVPLNRYMGEAGISDSREEALMYVRRLTGGKEPDPELIETFIDNGYKMIDYLHDHTPLRFSIPKGYPEYYSNLPGGKLEGRSLDPVPFNMDNLGDLASKIRNNPTFPPLTLEEGGALNGIDFEKIVERMENNTVTMGRSLIASLLQALVDREVEIWTESAGKELIADDDGAIIGLKIMREGKPCYVGAHKGVILASGGFEWNKQLVKTFLKGQVTHPLSPPGNEGDALIMAMKAGAALGNMSEAWWYPAMQDPTFEYEDHILNQLGGGGRTGPYSIIVNKHGKRFVNEGSTYNDLPKTFYTYDPVTLDWPNEPPVWLIFDQKMKDHTMILTMMPGEQAPEWVNQADNLRDLAQQIGIDAEGLEATVTRFNQYAVQGQDPDFQRGTLFFEDLKGGGGNPRANLGPIDQPPYYALPIYFGTLGTSGGPRININAQVIDHQGKPIEGLYSAGNAAMGIMGQTYASAGGTLGPALTFGYLAGISVSSRQSKEI